MSNKFNHSQPKTTGGVKPPMGGKGKTDMPMKTANWPGVPGKTQSRNRSGGAKKLRQSPREEGI